MNITVQRETLTSLSTQGEMSLDGAFECYTLEPPHLAAPAKPRAIDAGTYSWRKAFSNHLQCMVVLVENVPDFEGIEIHFGDFPKNTAGCTLVGSMEGPNFVSHSDDEFQKLMAKLPDTGTIQYLDAIIPQVTDPELGM